MQAPCTVSIPWVGSYGVALGCALVAYKARGYARKQLQQATLASHLGFGLVCSLIAAFDTVSLHTQVLRLTCLLAKISFSLALVVRRHG